MLNSIHFLLRLLLFVFVTFFSFCYGDDIVYRAVAIIDDPESIKRDRGFIAKGLLDLGFGMPENPNISLFDHVNGGPTGLARNDSGYIATTSSYDLARLWVNNNLGGRGYIYHIHATPNFIDVNSTLGRYSTHPGEMEYAALGYIRWEQIIGWQEVSFGNPGRFIRNRDYNPRRYGSLEPGGSQPQLAGFPANHRAWNEEPWVNYRQYSECNQSQSIRTQECSDYVSMIANIIEQSTPNQDVIQNQGNSTETEVGKSEEFKPIQLPDTRLPKDEL